MNLEQKIEAVLFYKNEPTEIKFLVKILDSEEKEVREALANLGHSLEKRGICLIQTDTEASLAASIETKEVIEKITKDEMSKDIGKAGLETLAIILYNGPITRREIDYIRGVNSTFILRNLNIRGLIEREADPSNKKTFKYRGSLDLLAHLGIKNIEELPQYDLLRKKVEEVVENTDGNK